MHNPVGRMLNVCLIALGFSIVMPGAAISDAADLEQVKAANRAYYAALSARDLAAMERVWTGTPRDVNVAPPIRPSANVGWHDIKKRYQTFWATLDELNVSMDEPHIQIHGTVAWVYGIEQAKRKHKDGPASGGPNFGTSIFIKEGGRWLMIFHQAALIPKPQ